MVAIVPTTDVAYLDRVFHDPAVADGLTDDRYPDTSQMSTAVVLEQANGIFLSVKVDGQGLGFFMFVPLEDGSLEAHSALLPGCRGRLAVQAGYQAIDWIFSNTQAPAITTYALSDSPAAMWFARMTGFSVVSCLPHEATRHGKPVEIVRYILQKSQWIINRH